jgi:hypothetical protein
MMRHTATASAVLLLACGGESTGPVGRSPTGGSFQYTYVDPVGDTLPPPANVFNRALDVEGLDVGLTAESIFVRIEFTAPISRWSEGALNSIDGYVDFDVDDNPVTGFPAATEEFGSVSAQMGVETYVSLRDDGAGHMLRRVGETDEWREVRVEFSSRSLTIRFARADVGETDGAFRVSAMIGGTNREITDLVPNSGHYRVPR